MAASRISVFEPSRAGFVYGVDFAFFVLRLQRNSQFSGGVDFACIYEARGSKRFFVVFGGPAVGWDWCFLVLELDWVVDVCGGSNSIYLRVSRGSDRICYHEVSRGSVSFDTWRCLEVWLGLLF